MDLIFANKPAGLTTHTSLNETERHREGADINDGFLELLSSRTAQSLWPVHRLDRETSGTILFAKDAASANEARECFENNQVEKVYQFVTNRTASADHFVVESFIEREENSYVSRKDVAPNSKTTLTKLKTQGRYSLWEARPESGRSHQIRLHAEDSGISILGDDLHGGANFPTLCLSSVSIKIDSLSFATRPPIWFESLELLSDSLLIAWLAAFDRRERWLDSLSASHGAADIARAKPDTYRWIHNEGDPLRLEVLGEVAWLSWYRDTDPDESEWAAIHTLLKLKGISTWYLQVRSDRGKQPNRELVFNSEPPPPQNWVALENELRFEFRKESGLSPGLFLDQRRNRAWLKAEAKGKTVLNLFCYTAGFSVAAAAGGAAKTVSVDLSRTFLEWSKRNFALNDLPLEGHEFRSIDTREYLAWAKKKGLFFDLIVCDPPSFSRSDKGIFKIEKDLDALVHSCLELLAPAGRLLFACNFELWSEEDFIAKVSAAIKTSKIKARLQSAPSPDLDFELPRTRRNMKSVFLCR